MNNWEILQRTKNTINSHRPTWVLPITEAEIPHAIEAILKNMNKLCGYLDDSLERIAILATENVNLKNFLTERN